MPDIEQARLSYLCKLRGNPDYIPFSIADFACLRGDWDTSEGFERHRVELELRERAEEQE